jgi:hypothetical protein
MAPISADLYAGCSGAAPERDSAGCYVRLGIDCLVLGRPARSGLVGLQRLVETLYAPIAGE